MAGALAGIRVLDLSDSIAGQFCTRMLADYGAEVLLVEPPGGGAMRGAPPVVAGKSFAFLHLNTGKGSVVLDASPGGRARLLALAAEADAIVIGPEADRVALEAAAPGAVVCTVSPFGTDGPWRDWTGCEMVFQAVAGLMHASGDGRREPLFGCGDRASYGAGASAYIAVLAGLFARGRWGMGQAASVDIAAAAACMANPFVTQFLYNGMVEPRATRRQPLGLLRCRDGWVGFWLHVHLYAPMMAALGLAEAAEDPRFKAAKARLEHWDAFVALLQERVAAEAADDVLAMLQSARVVAARCYSLTQLRDTCAHLEMRGFWESVDGETVLGPQFRMGATPRAVRGGAPAVGNATGFAGARRAVPALAPPPPPAGTGPLAGLRVVEFTTAWAGPMAGRILAWLGAEVIHVESASRTDSWRMVGQVFNPTRFPGDGAGERPWDRCALFNSQNANKLSLSLELKQPAAKAAMLRILAQTDVVLCNFTAGTLDRMGFGHAALKALRPDIIVAEMPAFGSTGPLSHATAIGPSMEMAAGMAGMIGYPAHSSGGGKPTVTGPTYPDPIGALHGAGAVLTALLHRQHTGQGQHIEVPQVEGAMHYIGEHILAALATGENPVPRGNRVDWAVPHDAFPAAGDDQWIAIAATNDAAWQALCGAMGRADLARFATLDQRRAHEDEIAAAVAGWAATQDKHAAAALLQSLGVAAAAVHDGGDGARSPYLAARGWFTELVHGDIGPTVQEGLPMALSRTPGSNRFASPCLGQHTHAILRDLAGLDEAAIAALDAAGATYSTPG